MSAAMKKLALPCAIATCLLVGPAVRAEPSPGSSAVDYCAPDELQTSGAVYRICIPPAARWNGELVVFAHGYVDPRRPIGIPEEQLGLPGGLSFPEVANLLGFAFATSSYRTNGLAVPEGLQDLVDLVDIFVATHGEPAFVYLVGASEGGLIAALGIEQYPEVFDGALAACGPVGDFRAQLDYFGDFRVVFDYFFPGLLPGSAVGIPEEVIDNWESHYLPLILNAVLADPLSTRQLLDATRAPTDRRDPASMENTVMELLWYNIHATNDAAAKLGGQPFDNASRTYKGLDQPSGLRGGVERICADPQALEQVDLHYQTAGNPSRPIVTLHTTHDPVVPFWHERLYRAKASASGAAILPTGIAIRRYGHCNFTAEELIQAFATLVREVRGEGTSGGEDVLGQWKGNGGIGKPAR